MLKHATIATGSKGYFAKIGHCGFFMLIQSPKFSAFDVGGPPSPYSMGLSRKRSLYVEERVIGEEYRYVLDRRYARKFPGNMLARPGLILNPWSLRKTETGIKNAQSGEAYEELSDLDSFSDSDSHSEESFSSASSF